MTPRPWMERLLLPALRALLTNPLAQLRAGIFLATVAVIAVAPSGNTHSAKAPSGGAPSGKSGSYSSAPNQAFAAAPANTPTVNTPNQPRAATRPLGGPLPAETEAEKDDFGVIH